MLAIEILSKLEVLQNNPAIYFNGCPCHVLHNAAQKAGDSFTECCGFDIEDLRLIFTTAFRSQRNERMGYNPTANFVIRSIEQ